MEKNYSLVNIDNDLIKECHLSLQNHKFNDNNIEYYDDITTMYNINLNENNYDKENIIKNIEKICSSFKIIDTNRITLQYTKYNIKDEYIIEPHKDYCQNTIIIYLNKNPNIKEIFTINNDEIQGDDLWANGGLIMNDEAIHSGKYIGSGIREIMCIFYD